MSDALLLDSLEATLLRIQALIPSDRAAWDTDQLLQLAIERLWITAGNAAEEYRKGTDAAPTNRSVLRAPTAELRASDTCCSQNLPP